MAFLKAYKRACFLLNINNGHPGGNRVVQGEDTWWGGDHQAINREERGNGCPSGQSIGEEGTWVTRGHIRGLTSGTPRGNFRAGPTDVSRSKRVISP